jgi:cyclohexadieny/prephenate dehydrogenase
MHSRCCSLEGVSELNGSFSRVALIGLGLIGSSLSHVMRRERLAGHIAGFARSAATRDKAVEIGLVDSIHESPSSVVAGADLVILCSPVGTYGALAAEFAGSLMQGAIVTDVGSVKAAVVRDVGPHLPSGVHFVPSHPIAGTEQSGPEAGFAELFANRWCVLTPLPGVDAAAVARLEAFWRSCGCNVDTMTPEHHDLVLAITSHLPHLIAYNIVATAADLEEVTNSEVIKYSAGGFRDFTRIAASDPTMWRDVFLNNKDAVLEMLGRFSEDLSALQRAIRWGEGEQLFNLFTRSREIRRGIIAAGQDTSSPDFGRRPPKA